MDCVVGVHDEHPDVIELLWGAAEEAGGHGSIRINGINTSAPLLQPEQTVLMVEGDQILFALFQQINALAVENGGEVNLLSDIGRERWIG